MSNAAVLEQNKTAVRRMLEAFNTGEVSIVYDVHHPDFREVSPCPGVEANAAGVCQCIERLRSQFPDAVFEEEFLLADGDSAVLRWKMTGTNTGPIFGRPPTGKRITHHGSEFLRFKDGLIIEHVDSPYFMDFFDKLGILDDDMLKFLDDIGARSYPSAGDVVKRPDDHHDGH